MNWTREEIVRDYRAAKDPKAQIRILAELNACRPEAIRAVLEEAGCEVPAEKRNKKKATNRRLDPEEAQVLYDAGATDEEIAARFGVALSTVAAWRSERELKKQKKGSDEMKKISTGAQNAAAESEKKEKKEAEKPVKRPTFTLEKREEGETAAKEVTVDRLFHLLEEARERGFGECILLVKGCSFADMWLNVKMEIRADGGGANSVELEATAAEEAP